MDAAQPWDNMGGWKLDSSYAGSRVSAVGPQGSAAGDASSQAGSLRRASLGDSSSRYETWIVLELCRMGSLQARLSTQALVVVSVSPNPSALRSDRRADQVICIIDRRADQIDR